MNVVEEYRSLWVALRKAETKEEKDAIHARMAELTEGHEKELAPIFEQAIDDLHAKARAELVRQKLAYVTDMLSMSKIAEDYFNRSRGWMSQKLSGKNSSGKSTSFTPEELNILADALRDISKKLEDVANNIHS